MKQIAERNVEPLIMVLRGIRVILDSDLARLYGVSTAALNQAVRRNGDRFPEDFAFRLTAEEKLEVITNCDHLKKLKYSRSLPLAFSEHGAIMVASVLNSARAVRTSLMVVRAFVRMRDLLNQNRSDSEQTANRSSPSQYVWVPSTTSTPNFCSSVVLRSS